MLRVGITGIDGLIGWHLRVFLHGKEDVEVIGADRSIFLSGEKLQSFVSSVDVIVHLAGMNRGDDHEIEETNVSLSRQLISACEETNCRPHILFSSSTHALGETPYGRSKRHCSELFQVWAVKSGAAFTNLILPHVFGESGKPFYNSVVSTFCYQLAHQKEPEIVHDGQLELLHAQDLSAQIWQFIQQPEGGDVILPGHRLQVSELLARLREMAGQYDAHIIPRLDDAIDLRLFNTYRSYLFPQFYPVALSSREDSRGSLVEVVKTLHGGQCFVSTTKPGITRGNHYHTGKMERFLVLKGRAVIRLRKMFAERTHKFEVCGDAPQYIDMPTGYAHNITNIGEEELVTLFWAHEIFDPDCPDTFMETV